MNLFNLLENEKANLIRLCAGAAVFTAVLFIDHLKPDFIQSAAPFPLSLALVLYVISYIILGGDIIIRALKNLFQGQVFDENFLMSIATVGAFIIGEYPEGVGVMLFYQAGEFFQERAVNKSKKSIADLMDIRPDYANLKKGNELIKVAPDTVVIGEEIIVKPGEKIPLDGIVTEGSSMIDTSALTGESVPRNVRVDSEVLSGCVNTNGKLTIKVTKIFGESTVSKIINLVQNAASKKAKTENFITKFARIYTPVVVMLAVLLVLIPVLFSIGEWKVWLHRALVFLVISCPCALVLSIPMGFFAGLGKAAKNGILVKGGNYLEAFNHIETAVFDKTGTLTKGVFQVTSIKSAKGFSDSQLLELAANAEKFSNHPIALSIRAEFKKQLTENREILNAGDYTELAGCGVKVCLNGKLVLAGNEKLMLDNGIVFEDVESAFGTKVFVSCNGVYAGCIIISDEVKPDSKNLVSSLKKRGVEKTVMLTGDNPQIAKSIADELGLDEVYGGLLPQEKVEILEKLIKQKANGKKLIFVGDGINDAPVLAIADIGVAMGALGSDAAIEAADAVIMTDEPSKLAKVIDIARFTGKIIRQNIIFILCVKVIFLALGAFGIATMWEAVFADVGVSLLAVLNAMRIMRS